MNPERNHPRYSDEEIEQINAAEKLAELRRLTGKRVRANKTPYSQRLKERFNSKKSK